MSFHEYLQNDPACTQLLEGAVLAVGPFLDDPDPVQVTACVDAWADALASHMPLPWTLHGAVDAMNTFLFRDLGLQGDRETYDDPANAVLPLVLARRKGMPIALSILWIEVARRLGFHAVGVGLPGHFITGLVLDVGTLYYDPFNGGRSLGAAEAAQLVAQATGGRAEFQPAMLAPLENRAILERLVRNLHVRFSRTAQWDEALWTATHLVLLCPEQGSAYRDRAFVRFKRGEMEAGLQDLQEAIRLSPDGDPELAAWLDKLKKD
jgi:regulator of sirC expression with transglutaminase-like and TPR domain